MTLRQPAESAGSVKLDAPPPSAAVQEPQLRVLLQLATILATEQDLDTMLTGFLTCLIETLDTAEYGALLLYDSGSAELHVRAVHGYDIAAAKQIHLSPGEGTCGWAFQAEEPVIFSSASAIVEARGTLRPENQASFAAAAAHLKTPQSSVCLPLIAERDSVGVLMLENLARPDGFGQADLPFLRVVAGLIALAVENAFLREEIQTIEALREANRLKTELISTLGHELRTPLTSIKGYSTALLMEETTFSPALQHEFLQIIDQECDTLQDLVHDLLESSVIDAGLIKLELQPVRLPRLVRAVVENMKRRTDRHQFLVDFPAGFPITDADPDRITQVIRNLVDNAIKYSPDGGLIVVHGKVVGEEVVVSVADQGIGLAPEHVNRLFEVGFRVKSGLVRHVAGSGLGLPICLTIMESHRGRIWAESELGQGSTLYISLPITQHQLT